MSISAEEACAVAAALARDLEDARDRAAGLMEELRGSDGGAAAKAEEAALAAQEAALACGDLARLCENAAAGCR